MKRRQKVGCINAPTASGQNVGLNTHNGVKYLNIGNNDCADTSNPNLIDVAPALVIPEIKIKDISAVKYLQSQTEITQLISIYNDDFANNPEVIVADEKYRLEIGHITATAETGNKPPFRYGYTAPDPVGTGASAQNTARAQVYNALVSKINAVTNNYVTAYALTRIPFTAGAQGAGSVVGSSTVSPMAALETANKIGGGGTVTGGTSGSIAKIAAIVITSGDIDGVANDAAGYLYVYNADASFTSGGETLTIKDYFVPGSYDIKCNADGDDEVTGQGIVLVGDSGYWDVPGYGDRQGACFSNLLKGFDYTTVNVARKAIYERGQGTKLAKLNPTFNRDKSDVITGNIDYIVDGDDFNSSKTYTEAIIEWDSKAYVDGKTNTPIDYPQKSSIFIDEVNTSNRDNFVAQIVNQCINTTGCVVGASQDIS